MIPSSSVYWLDQALASEEPVACPPLVGDRNADVCIVGGGYTGLWTAIEIKSLAPEASVVVLEARACGFGASGRNAGWMTSWYDEIDNVTAVWGIGPGLWLADESSATIDRIEAFLAEHAVDCHLRRSGSLWVASTAAQVEQIREAYDAAVAHGRADRIEAVGGDEIAQMTGASVHSEGLFIGDGAAVQPALLARGLRRVALRLGVEIHEGSPMVGLERGAVAGVSTDAGTVHADRVVLATNAWMRQIRELRRTVFVVGSQMILTGPVPDRLADLRWRDGLLFGDARLFVHATQVTTDGRILFNRGGGAAGLGGRVIPKHFHDPLATEGVVADFRAWFPQLADIPVTHAWGGPVDRTPDHLPFVGRIGEGNVFYGLGYSGNGVGPSALIGRILGRLALGVEDAYTRSAIVSGPRRYLPPEPLTFAGGLLVREGVRRTEVREELGLPTLPLGRIARRLVSFSLPR